MHTDFPTLVSYRAQREQFLAAATAVGARLTEYWHPLPGPFDEALSTDVAVLGDPNASKLLVSISGTHGVEGFYGSNCQTQWLQMLGNRSLPADTAIVMIHLINPWGTAWLRRVNEDNIDLNRFRLSHTLSLCLTILLFFQPSFSFYQRNFLTPQQFKAFKQRDPNHAGYDTLNGLFNPTTPPIEPFYFDILLKISTFIKYGN